MTRCALRRQREGFWGKGIYDDISPRTRCGSKKSPIREMARRPGSAVVDELWRTVGTRFSSGMVVRLANVHTCDAWCFWSLLLLELALAYASNVRRHVGYCGMNLALVIGFSRSGPAKCDLVPTILLLLTLYTSLQCADSLSMTDHDTKLHK